MNTLSSSTFISVQIPNILSEGVLHPVALLPPAYPVLAGKVIIDKVNADLSLHVRWILAGNLVGHGTDVIPSKAVCIISLLGP